MSNFRLTKLSELVIRVKVGFVGPINEYYCKKENGVPLIRTTDINELGVNYSSLKYVTKEFHKKNKKSQINKGDLIIARHGENGKANVFKEDFAAQVLNAVIIEPNQTKLNSNLLKYFFDSPFIKKQILGVVKGSVQGVINTAHIADVLIPISDTINYKGLTKIINDLDSKIELNNRINAELEAMAKTLYDYWFVQFDFPDKNGKPYKTSGGKMVWNEELKREVPEGWEVEKMAEWLDIDKSGDWGKEAAEGNFTKQVVCFRGADINGLNGLDELKPPVRYILEKNSFKILKSHDLIIEISGGSPTQSTGRLAFITNATIKRFEHPLICSNFCKPVSMRNKKLLYNFVYYWKSLYDNGIFFGYEGKTSGIKNLLLDSFISSYCTVVPNEKIVEQFYNIMENIQEKKQTTLAENQKLTELRDWLLPMLMNGQVKVSEL
jgi:type I restriction enzyme S subunit